MIVTAPTEPTLAVKSATSIIPVVFVQVADPVQSGIVKGLARAEGNVTGMSALAADITGKRLALLKEMLPDIKRIAVLWHRTSKGAVLIMHEYLATGPKLGMDIVDAGVDKADETRAQPHRARTIRCPTIYLMRIGTLFARCRTCWQAILSRNRCATT